MDKILVLVQSLDGIAKVPEYATDGSSGFDLVAAADAKIEPGTWTLIGTKIAVAVPQGYELQIRSRSGMALKKGLIVLNQPGTLDSDYRGELGVILFNVGKETQMIATGDRIAQGVICPVVRATLQPVDELDATTRGASGYGSTGK